MSACGIGSITGGPGAADGGPHISDSGGVELRDGAADAESGDAESSDAQPAPPPAACTVAELGAPFDTDDDDLVGPAQHSAMYGKPPEIIGLVDGTTIHVLWQDRSDESDPHAFLVSLEPSGDDYVATRCLEVATLDRIMGLARDPGGNFYIATGLVESLHHEITVDYPAPDEYRAGIVHLSKIDRDGQSLYTTDVDLARASVADSPEQVINPMVAASSRLAYGSSTLALVHGINTDPDSGGTRHQKALTTHFAADSGEVTRSSSIWVSHSFDERIFHDGSGFIEMHLGDAYPRTIAFARVAPDSGTYPLFHIKGDLGENNTRTRLGAVVQLDRAVDHDPWGYMAVVATERTVGTTPIGSESRIAGARDLALIRVRTTFEDNDRAAMDHVDQGFGDTQTVVSSGQTRTNHMRWLTDYHVSSPGGAHAERPKMAALGNDRYAVLWERWALNADDDIVFTGTHAMIIDGNGDVIRGATQVTGMHLSRGDDAFVVDGQAAWLTGDADRSELQLHLLDAELGYRRVTIE